jgi:hypothetical protein
VVTSGITGAALFASACATGPSSGEASLTLDGHVRLTSASRRSATSDNSGTIDRGTTVKLLDGAATLSFGDGRTIELHRGTAVKVDDVPSVSAGDALVVAEDSRFRVKAAGTTFSVTDGAARVARGLGAEVSAYRGTVTISSAGRTMIVGQLRRATVATLGVLPQDVEPVRLRPTDVWDRRYLGVAMELTEQLQARSDGITGQLAKGRAGDIAFFTDVLPVLKRDSDVVASLLNVERAPGETLVGAAIAAEGRGASLADRWRDVFAFRDAGAAWGLVALDQRLADARQLSSTLDVALSRAQSFTVQMIAATKGTEPVVPIADVPADTPAVPDPSVTADPASVPPPSPPTTAAAVPALEPEPQPIRDTLDTVEGLVSGLLGALKGQE